MKINEAAGTTMPIKGGETEATTVFADTADTILGDYTSKVEKDHLNVRLMSILDYLKKPMLIQTNNWNTTELKNANIYTGGIGEYLNSNPIWQKKLEGFSLIRGTAVLRLLINANPFQQGKLLLSFLPCFDTFAGKDPSFSAMHNCNIAAKRQQPCVELDCRDGAAILKIPYITPDHWYNLYDQYYDWGTWILSVLSPLYTGSGGENEVQVSIYLHFEDVELSAPMVPQSSGKSKRKFSAKSVSGSEAEKELGSLVGNTISSALKISSTALGHLGNIPQLAHVCKPASWALGAASQITSHLGYSKPDNNVIQTNVTNEYHKYGATSEGADPALPIALRSDNALTLTDGLSIYEADEMSFSFLYAVSTCVETVYWTTSDLSNGVIYSKPIVPRNLCEVGVKTVGASSTNYGVGPPIYYFSNMFQLWRGSVNVTIKIPKTDYHSGRLQVTWTPSQFGINVPTLISGQYALREIIDIREGNEFSFNLPWMLEQNYVETSNKSGTLDIRILNELRAPETASQTLELLVYFSGGKDFELQVPGFAGSNSGFYSMPFSPQMDTGDELITKGGIAGEKIFPHETLYAQESMGEIPVSVKQFLNRNSQLQFRSFDDYGNTVIIYPWFNSLPYLLTGGVQGQNVGGDISMLIAPLYAFFRGSVKLTLSPKAESGSSYQIPRNVFYTLVPYDPLVAIAPFGGGYALGGQGTSNWVSGSSLTGLQGVAVHQGDVPISSVHIPYMSKNKCSLNLFQTNSVVIQADKANPRVRVNVFSLGNFTNAAWFRSYGEDFQYSYFVGCPPVFRP